MRRITVLSHNSPSPAPREPSKTGLPADAVPQPTRRNDAFRLVWFSRGSRGNKMID
jgi:hypothetical protein